jgi:N,N'-diacetylchitobiose transport system permease protein
VQPGTGLLARDLPASRAGLVSTGIFAFIQAWNEFIFALVIMTRPEAQTLPIWLRSFVQATKATDWAVVMAGSTSWPFR